MADITYDSTKVVPSASARLQQAKVADGAVIDPGEAVYLDSTGKLNLASALAEAASEVKGVAVNGGSAGQPVDFVTEGEVTFVETGSPEVGSLDIGQLYIVSDTPGAIRPAGDLGSMEYSGYIGTAKDASTLTVKPHPLKVATA